MFKKILVAIDGSERSVKALDFAVDLAEKYSAEIVLISVVPPIRAATEEAMASAFPPIVETTYHKELEDYYGRVLSEAFMKVQKSKPKVKISTILLEGRPAERILEQAKQDGCDFIIIGNRGLGGIKEFFLGSVSHRVADQAPCPVLIVK